MLNRQRNLDTRCQKLLTLRDLIEKPIFTSGAIGAMTKLRLIFVIRSLKSVSLAREVCNFAFVVVEDDN